MLDAFRSSPAVGFRLPPAAFFKLPSQQPMSLTPPLNEPSLAQPFQIPPSLYAQLLDYRVPITIAAVYATTVVILNRVNKARAYRPWAISKTSWFKVLVILHNVFLAVYSAWTCIGMWTALRNSIPRFNNEYGAVGVVDGFCRLAGPRGLGNGANYNATSDQWSIPNPEYQLAANGLPDPTDVGRLWNQGLAYYGWIFYLSKFYEVIDTAIILAKGKKSSTLQTYHHAGAMMCMWAGIRYMGQPIWIFVLVNSFIHAMMYSYYTVTALHIRVPNAIKRSLTTMQIMQFIFGTFSASSYMFIQYSVPIPVTRVLSWDQLSKALPAAASAAESGIAAATASAGVIPMLKKLAIRAAGAEGIAENVLNGQGQHFGSDAQHAARYSQLQQEAINSLRYESIDCVDNSGQAFAIWLNVMYLLPLTYLFARFFVRSYLRRIEPAERQKPSTQIHQVEQAGLDALKGVSREIRRAALVQNGDGDTSATDEDIVQERVRPLTAITEKKVSTKETKPNYQNTNNFETVPAKRRAKRGEAEKNAAPVQASNTFSVLKDNA
ncbi:putative fatty acid elongase [Talaromyces proteolyticus]|uniref:Elongation of fatty acids protein n=1 Tax=Talaromyces proteolyticus TaxID=1131652 RepID=A0AAD4PXB2_9EURO|nr:putative fatty acid elongase [Talaromyces proteolyticus]KAH8699147.1 putative fatty acid elongase [Talaromyces proteolyticus]